MYLKKPDIREDGEFAVQVNGSGMKDGKPGFVALELADELGELALQFDTIEEIDRFLRGAQKARRLLAAARVPHAYEDGGGYRCAICSVNKLHHLDPRIP